VGGSTGEAVGSMLGVLVLVLGEAVTACVGKGLGAYELNC